MSLSPLFILGLNLFDKDSAACLIKNGELVAAADEERFIRIKHYGGFPKRAVESCLATAGITLDDVHLVVGQLSREDIYRHMGREIVSPPPLPNPPVHSDLHEEERFGEHHLGHAASAYYASGFDESNILTVDAMGDNDTAVFFHGHSGRIERRRAIGKDPVRIGGVYENISHQLGFGEFGQGKVMGLAPYGTFLENGHDLLDIQDFEHVSSDYFTNFHNRFRAIRRTPSEPIRPEHQNLAATLQNAFEESILRLVRLAYEETGSENLCLAGGVFLNCSLNGRIARLPFVRRLFIQPNAADPGTALGLAWRAAWVHGQTIQPMKHAAWGPKFSENDIEQVLDNAAKKHLVDFERLDDPARDAAEHIARGEVIGWFQGRMEWGPRALGNRSLLADPRKTENRDGVNRLKGRESWRPLAPSVLMERADEWFSDWRPSRFMLIAFDTRPEKRTIVPAITHVDGSARPQGVERDVLPLYHRLIEHFEHLTDVPMVLNTSFNHRNEPIVTTPAQAVASFLHMGLDALVIGPYLVRPDRETQARRFPPLRFCEKRNDELGVIDELTRQQGVLKDDGATLHVAELRTCFEALDDLVEDLPQNHRLALVGDALAPSWQWQQVVEISKENNLDTRWFSPALADPHTLRFIEESRKQRLGNLLELTFVRDARPIEVLDRYYDAFTYHDLTMIDRFLHEDLAVLSSLGFETPDEIRTYGDGNDLRLACLRTDLRFGPLPVHLHYGQAEHRGNQDWVEARFERGTLRLSRPPEGVFSLTLRVSHNAKPLRIAEIPATETLASDIARWGRQTPHKPGFSPKQAATLADVREKILDDIFKRRNRADIAAIENPELETAFHEENQALAWERYLAGACRVDPGSHPVNTKDPFEDSQRVPLFTDWIDLNTALFEAGALPAATFENRDARQIEDILHRAEKAGVHAETGEHFDLDNHMRRIPGTRFATAFIAREAQVAKELSQLEKRSAETLNRREQEAVIRRTGELLDYPRCCVEFFIRAENQDVSALFKNATARNTRTEALWPCNNFLPHRLIGHFPHSYGCEATAKMAQRHLDALRRFLPTKLPEIVPKKYRTNEGLQGLLDNLDKHLKWPILYWDFFRYLVFDGEPEGNTIRYRQVLTFHDFGSHERRDRRFSTAALRCFHADIVQTIRQANRVEILPDRLELFRDEKHVKTLKLDPGHRCIALKWS